jgi:hypothetical protein
MIAPQWAMQFDMPGVRVIDWYAMATTTYNSADWRRASQPATSEATVGASGRLHDK